MAKPGDGTANPHRGRHGSGSLARRYRFLRIDDTSVVAGLEDDMHRFEVLLEHDAEVVRGATARGVRTPWDPCADAAAELAGLLGTPLTRTLSEISRRVDPRQQCTHQLDLTTLAIGFAASGRAQRDLLAVVPDWSAPPYEGFLSVDGDLTLHWVLDRAGITSPPPFEGQPLRGGFVAWCDTHLDADLTEAAFALQRAVWISPARVIDLESCETIVESGISAGVCYSSQPGRIDVAFRRRGSLRDFGQEPQRLLAGFPTIDRSLTDFDA